MIRQTHVILWIVGTTIALGSLCAVEQSAVTTTNDTSTRRDLATTIQLGTNVCRAVFLSAVNEIVESSGSNAIPLLIQKIDYRGDMSHRDGQVLGHVRTFEQEWPVAAALVTLGTPSLEALVRILEREDNATRLAIADTAMLAILGYERRNEYLSGRMQRSQEPAIKQRLKQYILSGPEPEE